MCEMVAIDELDHGMTICVLGLSSLDQTVNATGHMWLVMIEIS